MWQWYQTHFVPEVINKLQRQYANVCLEYYCIFSSNSIVLIYEYSYRIVQKMRTEDVIVLLDKNHSI